METPEASSPDTVDKKSSVRFWDIFDGLIDRLLLKDAIASTTNQDTPTSSVSIHTDRKHQDSICSYSRHQKEVSDHHRKVSERMRLSLGLYDQQSSYVRRHKHISELLGIPQHGVTRDPHAVRLKQRRLKRLRAKPLLDITDWGLSDVDSDNEEITVMDIESRDGMVKESPVKTNGRKTEVANMQESIPETSAQHQLENDYNMQQLADVKLNKTYHQDKKSSMEISDAQKSFLMNGRSQRFVETANVHKTPDTRLDEAIRLETGLQESYKTFKGMTSSKNSSMMHSETSVVGRSIQKDKAAIIQDSITLCDTADNNQSANTGIVRPDLCKGVKNSCEADSVFSQSHNAVILPKDSTNKSYHVNVDTEHGLYKSGVDHASTGNQHQITVEKWNGNTLCHDERGMDISPHYRSLVQPGENMTFCGNTQSVSMDHPTDQISINPHADHTFQVHHAELTASALQNDTTNSNRQGKRFPPDSYNISNQGLTYPKVPEAKDCDTIGEANLDFPSITHEHSRDILVANTNNYGIENTGRKFESQEPQSNYFHHDELNEKLAHMSYTQDGPRTEEILEDSPMFMLSGWPEDIGSTSAASNRYLVGIEETGDRMVPSEIENKGLDEEETMAPNVHLDESEIQSIIETLCRAQKSFKNVVPGLNQEEFHQRIAKFMERKRAEAGSTGFVFTEEDARKMSFLEHIIKYFEKKIIEIVKFAKCIPGFKDLSLDDQVNLIKVSRTESGLVGGFPGVNTRDKVVVDENNQATPIQLLGSIISPQFMTEFLKISKKIEETKIKEKEAALLRGITITFTDRCKLKEPCKVQRIQDKLVTCLIHVLEKDETTIYPHVRLGQLIHVLTCLRNYTDVDSSLLQETLKNYPNYSSYDLLKEFLGPQT